MDSNNRTQSEQSLEHEPVAARTGAVVHDQALPFSLGYPVRLHLPIDGPRSPVQRGAMDRTDVIISAVLTERLRDLSRMHGVTLFTVLLAGWAVLMERLSGDEDIVIGITVADRHALLLRLGFNEDLTVEQLLKQVENAVTEASAHRGVSFEQFVEALGCFSTPGHNPVFQVLMRLDNTFDISPCHDLTLTMEGRGDVIVENLHYASELFERRTTEALGGAPHKDPRRNGPGRQEPVARVTVYRRRGARACNGRIQ